MQVEILNPQGKVAYRRPHDHKDVMEALNTPGYSVRGAEPKGEPQVRSSAGLAARVIVTQDLVNEIVRRAKDSQVGLHREPMTSLRITQYEEPCIESLSMLLVSAWEEKYDLVSVFSAAISVIEEKAANDQAHAPRKEKL